MTDERQPQPKRESEALRMLRSRRSVPNTAAPAADGDDPPAHSLRYDIGDEIGRGGVGIVYRGKDVELGREVAMKVLSEHHVANPDVIDRFIEEAQIGGQLQHPGIVPVYEIGLQHDDRPYFAMKLIQGETLAAQLARRPDVESDRPRLLAIYEQICQTMAYAHARRVVHRDLKPENVMIGAFGEVQVVDWGFAKVLAVTAGEPVRQPAANDVALDQAVATIRSDGRGGESVVGAVLGTPAYMPPEQALGDVDRMDLRSDVFGLGGILCEILTGAPPFRGEPGEALLAAARGRVEDAHARLDRCGADGSLVELCRQCLQPSPADRPADAGQVAAVVHEYLASLEDRARQAQIKAAEARVRARATLLLSAAAMLAVLLGGGGYLYLEQEAAARTERATARVQDASEKGRSALAAARTAGPEDVVRWQAATAAAAQVELLAADEDVSVTTRERIAELVATITDENGAAATARAQARRDRDMRDALVAIVVDSTAGKLSPSEHDQRQRLVREYDDLFASYLSIGRIADLEDEAVTAGLRGGAIATDLAVALDHWAAARRQLERDGRTPPGPDAARLRRLARRVDPDDEWRNAARDVMAAETLDIDRLQRLTADIDWDDLPPTSIQLLASSLWEAGARDRAIALLRRGFDRHPQSFALAFHLGSRLSESATADPQEALAYFRSARAIRVLPVCTERIAWLKDTVGDRDGALEDLERILADDPESIGALNTLGVVCLNAGQYERGLETLQKAAGLSTGRVGVLTNIGNCWLAQEDYEEAATAYERALEVDPDYVNCLGNYGAALHNLGRLDEAERFALRAIELDASNPQPYTTLGNIHGDRNELDEALAAFQRAIELGPREIEPLHNLAELHRRRGELEPALDCDRRALALAPDDPRLHASLAKTLVVSGQPAEALDVATKAQARFGEHAGVLDALARAQDATGRRAEAVANWNRVIELRPEHPDAYAEIGRVHGESGQPAKAVPMLLRALERMRKGNKVAIHSNLAACYANIGKPDESLDHARLAVEADPTHAPSRFNLGNGLVARRDFDGALEHLERASELWRADLTAYGRLWYPRACLQFAIVCKQANQPERAERVLSQCLERQPENADVLLELADVMQLTGRLAEAITLYERSLAVDDRSGFAWFNLARAQAMVNHPIEALDAARQSVPCFETDGSANALRWRDGARRMIAHLEPIVANARQLLEVARGGQLAESAEAQMEAASLAHGYEDHAVAVTAFERGFTRWPELLETHPHAYNAACAAARASAKPDVAAAAAAEMRDKAHAWLRLELSRLEGAPTAAAAQRNAVRERLEHWQRDRDLVAIREPGPIAALPESEQARWHEFWREVAALHATLQR
ncbi:MAG: tetratricopeptide repeat protein [Planctomycetes bacterium]|nr:tetratricopeptide repeat protein [Planctomycetota bacterium]